MRILSSALIAPPVAGSIAHTIIRETREWSPLTRAVLAVLVVVGAYILQVQGTIAQGYRIRAAEVRLETLLEAESALAVELAELRSIRRLGTIAQGVGLTPASDITYMELERSGFAERNHPTP